MPHNTYRYSKLTTFFVNTSGHDFFNTELEARRPETKKKAGIRRGETDLLNRAQSFAGKMPAER